MEKKNINLSELLKGAVEKNITLYCPWFGDMKVSSVASDNIKCYAVADDQKRAVVFDNEAYMKHVYLGGSDITERSAEPMLFPSKDVRSWDNFVIDVYPDLPKSWDELLKSPVGVEMKKSGKIPYAEEVKNLQMLLILRDEYRKSDKRSAMQFSIKPDTDGVLRVVKDFSAGYAGRIISFQEDVLAEKFLKSFSGLLEKVKNII